MVSFCSFMVPLPPSSTRTHPLSLHDALPILLQADGFTVRRAVLYEAAAATALPAPVAMAFAAGQYDAVLFFSPRTAATFATLALAARSEEHTSELQSLMRISYAVFCLQKKKQKDTSMTVLQSHKLINT